MLHINKNSASHLSPRILWYVLRVLEQQGFSKWFLDTKTMKRCSEGLSKAFTLTSNMYRQYVVPFPALKRKPLCITFVVRAKGSRGVGCRSWLKLMETVRGAPSSLLGHFFALQPVENQGTWRGTGVKGRMCGHAK